MTGTRRYITRHSIKIVTRCCVERCDNEPEPGAKMCAAHFAKAMEVVREDSFIRPPTKVQRMGGR